MKKYLSALLVLSLLLLLAACSVSAVSGPAGDEYDPATESIDAPATEYEHYLAVVLEGNLEAQPRPVAD